MAVNFPSNPQTGDTHSHQGRTWIWTGAAWRIDSNTTVLGYTGSRGYAGSQGDTGLGFRIAKSYASVAALEADTSPTGIIAGEFAIIETGDVDDAENSRLYLWSGSAYTYVTDLSGAAGLTGPDGAIGFTGSQGDTGFVGSQGDTGFVGSQGIQGDTGFVGSQGIQGDVGFVGSQGIQGDAGFTGSQGIQGDVGFVGSQGIQGDAGFTGSQGIQGDVGFVGSRGADGTIGVDGYTGSQGDLGYTGSEGESSFTWGNTAPVSPSIGDRWYDTKRGYLVVYVDDGDSQQWVEVSANGFLGQTGYTGSAGNITANIDQSTAGRALINDGTSASWATGTMMFRNKLINGNFGIWQRGTSQTDSGYNSADRWQCVHVGSTKTASREAFALGQTDVPNNPGYFMRHVVTSVAGAGNLVGMTQKIEGVETLSGQTVTVSFWAKADANKNIAVSFRQYFGTGGSPSDPIEDITPQKFSLTTTWTKYIYTVNLPSVTGKTLGSDVNDYVQPFFWFDAGSDFDARTDSLGQQSGTFDIAQVQLEEGSVATPFEMRPIGLELSLCHRYYQGSILYRMRYSGQATNQVLAYALPLKVIMRNIPSFTRTILNGGSINAEAVGVDYIYSEIFAASVGQTVRILYYLDAEL